MGVHDPYVVPFEAVTDKWVARCDGCGLLEQYETQEDAQERADRHLEEVSV